MRTLLLLLLCMCVLGALACGPSPEGRGSSGRSATAGMCPECGCTDLEVEQHTERSEQTGEPREYLRVTCRECGHSWRAPTLAQQNDW